LHNWQFNVCPAGMPWKMKKLIGVLFTLLLSACTSYPDVEVAENPIKDLKGLGEQTAENLTRRYNDEAVACRPFSPATAFECSGVILRGTSHSTQYHAWNPNPSATGVSASFLRRDSKFTNFYIYKNGFIFYPGQHAPADKMSVTILCFFPRDGATNIREDHGCGQSPNVPTSRECQSQGINTAERWVEHYEMFGSYADMCGFNVRDVLGENAVIAFGEGLKAQRLVFNIAIDNYNEIRMAKWEQDVGNALPIEAFFYFDDIGKVAAQYDQKDFLTETSISLPIIKIALPKTLLDQATFNFIPADQAIPIGKS